MTDHEVALVLPADAEVELLGEDVEVARGYDSTEESRPSWSYRVVSIQ